MHFLCRWVYQIQSSMWRSINVTEDTFWIDFDLGSELDAQLGFVWVVLMLDGFGFDWWIFDGIGLLFGIAFCLAGKGVLDWIPIWLWRQSQVFSSFAYEIEMNWGLRGRKCRLWLGLSLWWCTSDWWKSHWAWMKRALTKNFASWADWRSWTWPDFIIAL